MLAAARPDSACGVPSDRACLLLSWESAVVQTRVKPLNAAGPARRESRTCTRTARVSPPSPGRRQPPACGPLRPPGTCRTCCRCVAKHARQHSQMLGGKHWPADERKPSRIAPDSPGSTCLPAGPVVPLNMEALARLAARVSGRLPSTTATAFSPAVVSDAAALFAALERAPIRPDAQERRAGAHAVSAPSLGAVATPAAARARRFAISTTTVSASPALWAALLPVGRATTVVADYSACGRVGHTCRAGGQRPRQQ